MSGNRGITWKYASAPGLNGTITLDGAPSNHIRIGAIHSGGSTGRTLDVEIKDESAETPTWELLLPFVNITNLFREFPGGLDLDDNVSIRFTSDNEANGGLIVQYRRLVG